MREFGKYSIISPIGTGGMAEVFLAKSYGAEGLEKRLVIKRILPEFARRPKFVSMFIDEAKVAVSLNHPNIVQVFEFGKVGNDYYLAMELVEGTDLGRALSALRRRQERLSFGLIAYLGVEVAKALDYAHRKTDEYGRHLTIVHRDVSPQNILIAWDGSVKLVDFGIAKAAHTGDERGGVVKGKMSYMAPEQALGVEVDHRADLFSLGAVLFEVTSGRAPFPRGKPEEILTLIRSGIIPDISTLREDLPHELRHIIMKSVARDPEDRYASARLLQLDLTRYLFSLGEIHDAGSLADALAKIRVELNRAEEPGAERDAALVSTQATAENPLPSPQGTLRETASLPRESTPRTGTPTPVGTPSFRERRETFVLVGDLLGLFELRGRLSDDRWRGVLNDYRRLVEAIAFKNLCFVQKLDERGFMLLAGIPVSSENDAETALRVARDLIEAVDGVNLNLPAPLQLSIGIGNGGLILERHQQDGDERYTCVPELPSWDIPRTLAKEAMPSEILVDALTRKRTRGVYEFTEVSEAVITSGEGIFRVDRPKSNRQRLLERRKSFTTLHGRDFEIQLLRQAFQDVRRRGTVKTVILIGDPGVGKASIVEEFTTGLPRERVRIIRASCSADLKDKPFAPVLHMLEELLQLEHTADLRARKRLLEDRVESILQRYDHEERRYIFHALALLFNVKVPDNVIEALDPERRRARMFLSLRRLVGAAAGDTAAVVVVNDVQWADQSSMEFFNEVVGERRKRPILVCLTARPHQELLDNKFWKTLATGDEVIVHRVGDLSPGSARALVQDLLDTPMDPALVERIVERSGGNPLFIKEILESLQEEGVLVERDGHLALPPDVPDLEIPATVEGIVAGRIGSLPPEPKVVLLRCSLIGREMDERQLEAVFGQVPRAELDILVERALLGRVEEPDGRVRYRFNKGLTRDVAAKAVLEEERSNVHSRLADHLIDRQDDFLEMDLVAVARHLEAGGKAEDAGQYYLLAAASALDSTGLTEGLTLVDRALALLNPESETVYTALDLKEKLLKEMGRPDARREILARLREFVDKHGPPEHDVQLLIRQSRFEFDLGHMEASERWVREALERAALLDDERGRASALAQLAAVLRNTGRHAKARQACDEALAIFDCIDDAEGAAQAWNQMGILNHQDGQLKEALAAYERVVELAKKAGMRSMEEVARINIGFCLVKMGDLERAVNTYRQVLHEILQLGHRRNEAALLANLGHAQVLLGDYARAEHTLRRCIRLSRRSSDAMRTADGLLTLATAHLERGRLDEAEKLIKPGLKSALESNNNYLVCHGYLLSAELKIRRHSAGDLEGAAADAERVLSLAKGSSHLFALARAESMRARVFARMDHLEEALAASHRAIEWLEQGAVEGAEHVLYEHAYLLHKAGQEADARAAITRAHQILEAKRDRIVNPQTQRTFTDLRANSRIFELYRRLAA